MENKKPKLLKLKYKISNWIIKIAKNTKYEDKAWKIMLYLIS